MGKLASEGACEVVRDGGIGEVDKLGVGRKSLIVGGGWVVGSGWMVGSEWMVCSAKGEVEATTSLVLVGARKYWRAPHLLDFLLMLWY